MSWEQIYIDVNSFTFIYGLVLGIISCEIEVLNSSRYPTLEAKSLVREMMKKVKKQGINHDVNGERKRFLVKRFVSRLLMM